MQEIDAYVLNITIQKEADAIISFLTTNGFKQSYIRGVMRLKSKHRILTNRLIKVRLTYVEAENYIKVKEVKLLEYPSEIALGYQINMSLSNVCREIIQMRTIDHQASYYIFDQMMHDLEHMQHYRLLLYANATMSMGMKFSLNACVKCGSTKNIVNFDLFEGGYLCQNCARTKVQASLQELRTINQLFNHQVQAFLKNEVDEVFALKLVDFINQTNGYKLSWE